ncbi:MAG: hypothetical protein IMW85_03765 [Thermicanus sp.]|nr:hypothetical protein [Thermicanus sp.]
MKNVIISRISRFIFTENQLKAVWERLNKGGSFQGATPEQLMELAKKELENSSLQDLAHHIPGMGYRDAGEMVGKTIAEKSVGLTLHLEVIDTDLEGDGTTLVLDRVLKVECEECGFIFYVDDINEELSHLKCPHCQGRVHAITTHSMMKREEKSF